MVPSTESSTKKIHRMKEDRISKLPQNLQETILGFLPIQDAVKSSILSTKWRHCWTMIPNLIFDFEFVDRIMSKLDGIRNPELRAHKLVSVINKVLLLHNGPILKFSLTFPAVDNTEYGFSKEIIHEYIDQWIPLFARKGIKQLTLDESSKLEDFRRHNLSSLDLTHLTLLRVWFPYTPTLGKFTCLTNLELVDATSNFGKSIFHCPVLEKLTLIICEGLFPNNFCAPNLKRLVQIYREITSEYSLVGLKNLSEYSFMLAGHPVTQAKTSNVAKVLGGVHKIKRVSLAKYSLKGLAAGGFPNRLSKPLPYLKFINISDIDFGALSEVSCLVCLIRSAPNLRTLHIVVKEELEEYQIEDSEECIMLHLEIVSFSDFKGVIAELELVKFLLACSPSLKSLFIHRDCSIKDCASALKITEEMLQYTRASPRAQIRHLESPVNIIYGTNCFDRKLWSDNYSLF
ncbi:hypothetical protein DCAR_0415370 [Daucus carota subsp. sativus]|uniref:F-box domain-containing protein n=1 Tax=Daucus carota subsp. sativus TaxID=79200 RepID=A0AAF0WY41_DAUCS|nr:hypothetical protein DCAR_0415370 [Daucus carota subsp. sativus]